MNQRLAVVTLFFAGVALSGCSTTPKPAATTPLQSNANRVSPTGAARAAPAAPAQAQKPAPPIARDSRFEAGTLLANRVFYFDFDMAIVRPEYATSLTAHAKFLSASKLKLRTEGHADERGSTEYNMALGQKRSDAVRNALTALGAAKSAIEAISWGEEKPAMPGHDEAAWSKNRRVEIRYSDEK